MWSSWLLLLLLTCKVFTPAGGLSQESEWQQASTDLLYSYQYSVNNAVVWTDWFFCWFSVLPVLFSNLWDRSKRTNYDKYHHQTSCFTARSKYYLIFLAYFYFYSVVSRKRKIYWAASCPFFFFFFYFFVFISSCFGLLVRTQWSVCISKSQKILWVPLFWRKSGLCMHHLVLWTNLNLLHNSQWITFPIQSWQVLYSFCSSLLHLPIMWLTVFFFFLRLTNNSSCFAYYRFRFNIIGPYGVLCATLKRDSVATDILAFKKRKYGNRFVMNIEYFYQKDCLTVLCFLYIFSIPLSIYLSIYLSTRIIK